MYNKTFSVMKNTFKFGALFLLFWGGVLLTSCADYKQDIDSINDRIDALEAGSIAQAEEQIAKLEEALKTAEESIKDLESFKATAEEAIKNLEANKADKKDLDALKDRVEKNEKSIKDLNDLIKGIQDELKEKMDYVERTFATKKAVEELNTQLGNVIRDVEELGKKLDEELAKKLDKSEYDKFVIEINNKVDAVKAIAEQAVATANEALGKVNALIAALGVYADGAKIDEALQEKLNIADFDEKFEESLKEALANNGVITNAIANAIKEETDKINKLIEALSKRVDNLASRIQSLVFVPEYSDGLATATLYKIGTEPVEENEQVLNATFQVTPKEYAALLTAENTAIYLNTVQTRAASNLDLIDGENFKVVNADPESGLVDVQAVLPVLENTQKEGYAIALYVFDSKKADENAETDEGSFVMSQYVGVKCVEHNIAEYYVLYDAVNEGAVDTLSHEVVWNAEYPAKWNVFENHEIRIQEKEEYLTFAEAAERYNVAEEKITPKFERATFEYKNSAGVVDETNVKQYLSAVSKTFEETYVQIRKKGDAMKQAIGMSATINNRWTVNNVDALKTVAKYAVVGQEVTIELPAETINWTYDWALKHSTVNSDNTVSAYNKDIDFTAKWEQAVKYPISGRGYATVKLNGEELRGSRPFMYVEKTTNRIYVRGKYEFAKLENIYEFENTYYLDKDNKLINPNNGLPVTKLIVKSKLILGALPADVSLHYEPISTELITKGFKYVETPLFVNNAFADVASYFGSYVEFCESLFGTTSNIVNYLTVRTNDGVSTPIDTQYTRLEIAENNPEPKDLKEDSRVRLSSSAIASVNDRFAFETSIDTWYGVKYTFNIALGLVAPDVKFVHSPEFVNNGVVTVHGKVVDDKYVVDNSELSKYFTVAGITSEMLNNNDVEVEFAITTKENVELGIKNLPQIVNNIVGVNENGTLTEGAVVVWNDYTATELEAKASLKFGTVEVATLPVKLVTDKIVTKFACADKSYTYEPNKQIDMMPWANMTINVIGQAKNFANTKATSLEDVLINDAAHYDLELEIKSVKAQYEDGTVYPESHKWVKNPDGTITFTSDNADLIKDIHFIVEFELRSMLDYDGKQAETCTAKIVLKKNK